MAVDSWKARHIPASGQVAVTVAVRRGGLLSLLFPIPSATVSFHAWAVVHPVGWLEGRSVVKQLGTMLPAERCAACRVIEICPQVSS